MPVAGKDSKEEGMGKRGQAMEMARNEGSLG